MPRRGILQTVKRYVFSCVTVNNKSFILLTCKLYFNYKTKIMLLS